MSAEYFKFGKSNYITEDINYLYQSIYEGNTVDQDTDGDNDGADVMIARMIASGMLKEEAIRRTRNKYYNKHHKESYNLYDLVIDYMIENGYADNVENAEIIFENMSDEFQNAFINEVKTYF